LFSSTWIGVSGRNGMNSEATAIDTILPKFDDVPMRRYFMMLA
jgi:hypothetical protein